MNVFAVSVESFGCHFTYHEALILFEKTCPKMTDVFVVPKTGTRSGVDPVGGPPQSDNRAENRINPSIYRRG